MNSGSRHVACRSALLVVGALLAGCLEGLEPNIPSESTDVVFYNVTGEFGCSSRQDVSLYIETQGQGNSNDARDFPLPAQLAERRVSLRLVNRGALLVIVSEPSGGRELGQGNVEIRVPRPGIPPNVLDPYREVEVCQVSRPTFYNW